MLTSTATAQLLAREHLQEDQGISQILRAPSDDEVRLVEVTSSVTDSGEVRPFRFAPDPPDVPYPSVVILLSPGDWDRIQAGELALPDSFRELEPLHPRQRSGNGV